MEPITEFFAELAQLLQLEKLAKLAIGNIWAVLVFAVGTLLTILGLRYARRQDKRAEAQDADIPELLVDFFGHSTEEIKDYYFLLPFKEKARDFCAVGF